MDSELSFHFCATWHDVRNKATEISKSGGVRISVASGDGIGGEVQGEHGVYQTMLTYVPGSRKVGYWECGCKWASYAWGRAKAYQRFEGRMCAHALAMQFEAQRQHAFDRGDVNPHEQRPEWLRGDTRVVVHHQRGTEREPARDHYRMGSTGPDVEGVYPSGHALDLVNTPLHAVAYTMAAEGADPGSIMRELLAFGAAVRPAQNLVREAVTKAEDHIDDGLPKERPGDAREHAEDFGAGIPEDGNDDDVTECDQCGGRGCGHCGGAGQVKGGQTTIPDQNADAGIHSRGLESIGYLVEADYASGDPFPYSAPEVMNPSTRPDHSNSKNPGSTGYATSTDPQNWEDAWAQRDSMGGQHFSSKDPEPGDEPDVPTHAGVAVKAHDTGNVLFLQRAHPHKNPDDPAAGHWEFPGGGLDSSDQTTLHGAIREWEEEVGHPFPKGVVHHTWRSGPYQGHLVLIPNQDAVDPRAPRSIENPDGDNEAVAWHNPRYMRNRADTRAEVKSGTPWGKIENAKLEKSAELNTEPEPALPATTADEESDDSELGIWGPPRDAKGHIPVGGNGESTPAERYRSDMTPGIGGDTSVMPSSGSDHITPKASRGPETAVADIVANFQATAAASLLQSAGGAPRGSDGISDGDIALAAKTALKQFTPGEQAELISEGGSSVRARNFGDLRIEGTHYEDIPEDSEELVL
jgi:8-oxo-dGTP pyrophosphatase MutT (NUDIX family)